MPPVEPPSLWTKPEQLETLKNLAESCTAKTVAKWDRQIGQGKARAFCRCFFEAVARVCTFDEYEKNSDACRNRVTKADENACLKKTEGVKG